MRRLGNAGGADQVAVLLKLARNAEQKLSDVDQAVGFLRQLLDADPGNGFGYLELERILRAAERWYDLVDVLGKHADTEAAAGRKPIELALRVAIANVWEKDLDSPDSAAEALEKVLEVAPDNVAALLSLARVHERNERWDDAGEALERAAANAHGARGDRRDPLPQRHHPSQQGGRSGRDRSGAAARGRRRRRPSADAGGAGEAGARRQGRRAAGEHPRPASCTRRQTTASGAGCCARSPALYGGPLAQPAAALPYLERLVALDPTEIPGARAAGRGAARRRGGPNRRPASSREADRRADQGRGVGKRRARWQTRLGTIAEARGDTEGAAASFNAAYKLDPSHPATIAALGRLAYRSSDFDAARKFYRSLLLQNFDDKTAGVSKAEVYLMLGRMHVLANEPSKARNMFERGLEIDPKNVDLKAALGGLR